MKWIAITLALALGLPAVAQDPVADLEQACKSGKAADIERAIETLVSIEPADFEPARLVKGIKTALAAPKAKGNEEIVVALCNILTQRYDAEPQHVVPQLLGSMKKGNDAHNAAIDKMFRIKTCHKVTPKGKTWKDRDDAWRARWATIKELKHPEMVFAGLRKAGLKMPVAGAPKMVDETSAALFVGLDHAELHVRENSFMFLGHAFQPKQFGFDAAGPVAERRKAIADMKLHFGNNKAKVQGELKKMLDFVFKK